MLVPSPALLVQVAAAPPVLLAEIRLSPAPPARPVTLAQPVQLARQVQQAPLLVLPAIQVLPALQVLPGEIHLYPALQGLLAPVVQAQLARLDPPAQQEHL